MGTIYKKDNNIEQEPRVRKDIFPSWKRAQVKTQINKDKFSRRG